MLRWTVILAIVFVHVSTSEGLMDWQQRPKHVRGNKQDLVLFHGLSGRQCRPSHVTLTVGSMTEPPEDNNDFCLFKNGVLACRRRPSMLNDANWLQNTLYDYREHPDVNGNPTLEAVLECALDKLNQLGNPESLRSNVVRVQKRAALYRKPAWGFPSWAGVENLIRPARRKSTKPHQKHTSKPPTGTTKSTKKKPQAMPTTVPTKKKVLSTISSIATSVPRTTAVTASNETSETPPPNTTAITTEPAKEQTTSQEVSSSTEFQLLTPEYLVHDTHSDSKDKRQGRHSNRSLFIILMVGSAVTHLALIVLLVLAARRLAKKRRRSQKQKPKPVKSMTNANSKVKEAEPLKSTETSPNQTQTVDLWK